MKNEKRQEGLCPKSQKTIEDTLVMALRFLDELEVVHDAFAREYDLRPNTLTDISAGKVLKKGRDKYRNAMILKLESLRKNAILRHKDDVANRIINMVYSITLVELGIASLDEQNARKREEERKIFMSQFR